MAQVLLNAPSVPDIFANQIRLAITLTDFTLIFGTMVSDQALVQPGMGFTAVADKAAIHVAPAMLKQILLHLEMAVSAYEAVIGPIKVPNRLASDMSKHQKLITEMLRQQMEDVPAE